MNKWYPAKLFVVVSLLMVVLFTVMTLAMHAQEIDQTPPPYSLYLPVVLNATDAKADQVAENEFFEDEVLTGTAMADMTPALAGSAGFLRAQGRQIVNGSGQPVQWRGVNMDTYYYFAESTWPDAQLNQYANQSDIQYLDKLGVTVIRLALHWKYFNSDLGYRLIDQYLAWCEAAGIYVILDMHVVPPDKDFGQEKIWTDPTAQQQFVNLWQTIALRYRDRASVAGYDLYNEPRPPNPAQWWTLADRVTKAIRTVDLNHILIVETPTWPQVTLQKLNDPNIVYAYHDYDPLIVTHAGVDWGLDSPVPSDYPYPGKLLTGFKWVGYAAEARNYSGHGSSWVNWDSGKLTPVANGQPGEKVEWAALKPYATNTVGSAWFDDLEVYKKGIRLPVTNASAEEASPTNRNQPRSWYFYAPQASDYTGAWSSTIAHTGGHSLQITGHTNFGIWVQYASYFTSPLFRVKPGDTFQLKGWLYAPENNGGTVGLGLDYLTGVYQTYNYDSLRNYIQPTLQWAVQNNVPLYVGEFGSTPNAPGQSRDNLLRDKIKLMNAEGVYWSLWTFRTPADQPASFGLYSGNKVDKPLGKILQQGLR